MSWKKVNANLSCSLSQNEMSDNADAGVGKDNSADFRQINSYLARF